MRSVNIFEMDISVDQVRRTSRNIKVIYTIGKYGSKAVGKLNPTLVFIDAAISLGEAAIAYSRYRQTKEITKQLEIALKSIKYRYENLKKALKLEEEKLRKELAYKQKTVDQKLKNNRKEYRLELELNQMAYQYVLEMKETVNTYRREYPDDKKTKEIEAMYFDAVAKYMENSISVIGGG